MEPFPTDEDPQIEESIVLLLMLQIALIIVLPLYGKLLNIGNRSPSWEAHEHLVFQCLLCN